MDDGRVWDFERSLWTADAEHYERSIDEACLMALPAEPFVFGGAAAVRAVQGTPRWDSVEFSGQHVTRPQEGMIVIAYTVDAAKGDEAYRAHCTSVYRRRAHEDWTVVQHAQVVAPTIG